MIFKILFVNEHSDLHESSSDLQARGFNVQNTSPGNGFIKKLQKFDPDVIVFDSVKIGEKNEHTYHSLRQVTSAPILVLSVVDLPGIVEKTLDRGADEYLIKPVSPNILAARINALARRTPNSANA
ncbi:MAG: response regulator [Anaerolineales bacterium]|nr:response regulator [Chloroflexota bacterium]MBL6982823.1 response regulator [Anaerolineales bacterium]